MVGYVWLGTNVAKRGQTEPKVTKSSQKSPNVAKRRPTSPNITKRHQTLPNVAKLGQTSPNVAKCCQTAPNVTKRSQTSPNIANCSQTSSNVEKRCQTSPNVAKCHQTLPNIAKCQTNITSSNYLTLLPPIIWRCRTVSHTKWQKCSYFDIFQVFWLHTWLFGVSNESLQRLLQHLFPLLTNWTSN